MIRVYTVSRKKLQSGDILSSNTLNNLSNKVDWLWIDASDLDKKETKIISTFFGIEEKIFNEITKGKIFPCCERYRDCVLISIPSIEFEKALQVHPISVIIKEKMLITLRNECDTRLIGKVVETLGGYMVENGEVHPSFVVNRLFREIADQNSEAMMSLRELIDEVEEKALAKPWDKSVTRSVFRLKKEISTLHRLLWVEKELMSDVKEHVIPYVELDEEARLILGDAIDDIERELEFVDSYGRALDGILRLQDLGLIHRVERNLIYLTAVILLLTIISIILSIILK
ncbi:MAG: CorA family divalent cation transporter [Candidatus Bathyarchaeia archaeon]